MKRSVVKIFALSAWMYVSGPLVWGAWMIWRLRILRAGDFLALLWPVGAAILLGFLAANLLNLLRRKPSALFHAASIAALGICGTTGFFVAPGLLGMAGPWSATEAWARTALIGCLAGISLIGMFYPSFSAMLFPARPDGDPSGRFLGDFHSWAYAVGLASYLIVGLSVFLSNRPSPLSALGMLLPALMSAALFRRSLRLIAPAEGRYDRVES